MEVSVFDRLVSLPGRCDARADGGVHPARRFRSPACSLPPLRVGGTRYRSAELEIRRPTLKQGGARGTRSAVWATSFRHGRSLLPPLRGWGVILWSLSRGLHPWLKTGAPPGLRAGGRGVAESMQFAGGGVDAVAPEGRRSLARGASPWDGRRDGDRKPWKGDRNLLNGGPAAGDARQAERRPVRCPAATGATIMQCHFDAIETKGPASERTG